MKHLRWLYAAHEARKIFFALPFSKRQIFLKELRPILGDVRAAYPDGLFIITIDDVMRARLAAR